MNRDLPETKLENLLRGLVPDAPSIGLMERIDEELKLDMSWLNATAARPPRQVRWLNAVAWSAVGAAAAVAVMSFLPAQPGTMQSASVVAAAVVPAPTVVTGSKYRDWDVVRDEAPPEETRRPHRHAAMLQASYGPINTHSSSRISLTPPTEERLVLPVNFLSEAPFSLLDTRH